MSKSRTPPAGRLRRRLLGAVLAATTASAALAAEADAAAPLIGTTALNFGQAATRAPVLTTGPMRFAPAAHTAPLVATPALRFSGASRQAPLVTTGALRHGRAPTERPLITTAPLRFGRSAAPILTTSALRYAPGRAPLLTTSALRYAPGRAPLLTTSALRYAPDHAPLLTTSALRYDGEPTAAVDPQTSVRLIRVTQLQRNGTNPFDFRELSEAIARARNPEAGAEPPADEGPPAFQPVALNVTGVPQLFVFGSIGLAPSGGNTWQTRSVNSPADPPPLPPGVAAGLYGVFIPGSGSGLRFVTGHGWSSPDLPRTELLPSLGSGHYGNATRSFQLTRQSDGRVYQLTLTGSMGSDGDVELLNASGFDCGFEAANCP
ncbi:hypothetical protein [Alkalilimnicola sp. S0819]|uniref:hypothetical protein n=1 Tax=Alkalilimnicola sp. S0819 TaxID=2613922 RepID=UPI0012615CDD|nr:hypothetical protein [Alkalilimnicola sp. S0819]KAB7624133.1 hypothetical protein F3N43_07020 [Alkalilimnicola sp. S0819]MPQ16386.1 hypothetical protein [Alkalilimnicola sp. S0819]